MIALHGLCVISSAFFMYFMTKFAIILSKKVSFYDVPKQRNIHKTPMPMLGGGALLISIALTMIPLLDWEWSPIMAGLVGGVFIFLIGLYDDKYVMPPWLKLTLQSMLIAWLFFNDVRIGYVTWPGNSEPFFFGPFGSYLATQMWMITIINMFNIIDGIDGLAVGVSCVTAVVLLIVSLAVSSPVISYLLCALIGSTAMFLRFNFFPAKIFLGDSGALLLGYCFALVSVLGVLKSTVSVLILLFVFAVPLMDLLLSVIRRLLKRKNIFYPDLEHIHHQLVRRGLSVRRSAVILYAICGVFGIIAVLASDQSKRINTALGGILFFGVLIYFSMLQLSKKQFKNIKK
jgi:UDP-GlcNAc:undecaprenyl-phosphate GlcNAc-1-phosphate transferase